jgi:uroporphyrinogen III methyltransferase/synthase
MTALLSHHRDVRALKGPALCALGPGTADRLRQYSVVADLLPDEYRAEGLLDALVAHGPLAGARVLLPRSDIGREIIAEQLRHAGAIVTDVVAYRTVLDEPLREGDPDVYGMLLEGRLDVVTFTSASAVRNFTADAARQAGITVSVQPASYTIGGLVDAIVAHLAGRKPAAV